MAPQTKRYVVVLAALLTLYFLFAGFPSPNSSDVLAYLGTWTDETGEPGNYIRFYQVPANMPPVVGLVAYEGRVIFHTHKGADDVLGSYNHGRSHEPLCLNIIVGGKNSFAAIRMLDSNHMLIRFTDDPNIAMADDAIDSPETKQMTRVKEREDR